MKQATRALYAEYLRQKQQANEELQHDGNLEHAIYMIDDIIIGGDFYDGVRCNDHNALLEIDYRTNERYITLNGERFTITWEDILSYGTVLVPETETYISDTTIQALEEIGYSRLPLNDNHIAGYIEK